MTLDEMREHMVKLDGKIAAYDLWLISHPLSGSIMGKRQCALEDKGRLLNDIQDAELLEIE